MERTTPHLEINTEYCEKVSDVIQNHSINHILQTYMLMSDRSMVLSDCDMILSDRFMVLSDRFMVLSDCDMVFSERFMILSD